MTFEIFEERFYDLSLSDRLAIYNNYCVEYGSGDDMIYDFDNDFFDMSFSSPMEAARATFFGNIKSWNDEYIKFDAYGNLESLSEYDVIEEIGNCIDLFFEHEELWEDFIEDDEDEEENEDD
jgi:hypothetical protein